MFPPKIEPTNFILLLGDLLLFVFWRKLKTQKRHFEINWLLALKNINYKASIIGILIMPALKNTNYKASIIGILIMLALKNINYKASIIGTLIMLALKNINYKASIIGISIDNAKGQTKSKWFFKPTFPPKSECTNSILLIWDLFFFVFGRNWRHKKDISKLTDL